MALFTSFQSGPWSDVDTWVGPPIAAPTAGDYVVITHEVLLDADASIGDALVHHAVNIGAGGRLYWPTNVSVTLTLTGTNTSTTSYGINIANGGILELGASGAEIGSAFIAKIQTNTAAATGGQRKIYVADGGTLKLYGCPNYRTQRTTIKTNVNAALPATIETTNATDWVLGDEIWVGTGADKTVAATNYEKVTIASIVDSTHFTADLLNNHVAGDLLVSGMRNVILDGNSVAGGGIGILFSNIVQNSNAYALGAYILASWAEFQYFGAVGYLKGISITLSGTATQYTVPAGHFMVQNCIFDRGYASAATYGIEFVVATSSNGFAVADSATMFSSNHIYGTGNTLSGLYLYGYGSDWTLDGFTFIGLGQYAIAAPLGSARPIVTNLWVAGEATCRVQGVYYGIYVQVSDSNFYQCNGVYIGENGIVDYFELDEVSTISNCKFYHSNGATGAIYTNPPQGLRNLYISDCTFYDADSDFVTFNLYTGGEWVFERCTFDKANTGALSTHGAIKFSVSQQFGVLKFISCDFGLIVQNKVKNIGISATDDTVLNGSMRVISENCRFEEPATFGWTSGVNPNSGDWPTAIGWAYQDNARWLNTWDTRMILPNTFSLELINCQLLDAATDIDQFPILYPYATRWGISGGNGAEMMNESNTKLDGTLGMKFIPFSCVSRAHFCRVKPIKFSVATGKTVTVKVSLQKHLAQTAGRRPKVHLFGCGLNLSTEMTDVNDTWEEQTVTGVTTHAGDMSVWFSGISEYEAAGGTTYDVADPTYSPYTIGTYYFWADGFSIVIA